MLSRIADFIVQLISTTVRLFAKLTKVLSLSLSLACNCSASLGSSEAASREVPAVWKGERPYKRFVLQLDQY